MANPGINSENLKLAIRHGLIKPSGIKFLRHLKRGGQLSEFEDGLPDIFELKYQEQTLSCAITLQGTMLDMEEKTAGKVSTVTEKFIKRLVASGAIDLKDANGSLTGCGFVRKGDGSKLASLTIEASSKKDVDAMQIETQEKVPFHNVFCHEASEDDENEEESIKISDKDSHKRKTKKNTSAVKNTAATKQGVSKRQKKEPREKVKNVEKVSTTKKDKVQSKKKPVSKKQANPKNGKKAAEGSRGGVVKKQGAKNKRTSNGASTKKKTIKKAVESDLDSSSSSSSSEEEGEDESDPKSDSK